MTNRERVMAALRGDPVDRGPLAFRMHNFATENSARDLAAEPSGSRASSAGTISSPSRAPDTPDPLMHAARAALDSHELTRHVVTDAIR